MLLPRLVLVVLLIWCSLEGRPTTAKSPRLATLANDTIQGEAILSIFPSARRLLLQGNATSAVLVADSPTKLAHNNEKTLSTTIKNRTGTLNEDTGDDVAAENNEKWPVVDTDGHINTPTDLEPNSTTEQVEKKHVPEPTTARPVVNLSKNPNPQPQNLGSNLQDRDRNSEQLPDQSHHASPRSKRSPLVEIVEDEDVEEYEIEDDDDDDEDGVEEYLIDEGIRSGHLAAHKRVQYVPMAVHPARSWRQRLKLAGKPKTLHVVEIVKGAPEGQAGGAAPPAAAPPGGAPPPPGGAPPPPGGAPPPPGGAPPPPGGAPPPPGGAPPPPGGAPPPPGGAPPPPGGAPPPPG